MAQLRLSVLKTFQATQAETPITGFRSVKTQALLAYLAVESDWPHRRDVLAGLLWPDQPERAAQHNLSQ
jgi:DNA-binding SARP family transcriptional activator